MYLYWENETVHKEHWTACALTFLNYFSRASQQFTTRNSCTASLVSFRMLKRSIILRTLVKIVKTILRIESGRSKGYFLHFQSFLLIYLTYYQYDIFRPCAGNDSYQASLLGMVITIGNKPIQLTVRQGILVHGKMLTNVFMEQQPFVGMDKLFPTEAA